jgi:uncharacterized membrane protein
MAPPYSKQPSLNYVTRGVAQSQASIRDNIASIWLSVYRSRRAIAEAGEAIAQADAILARRLPERGDSGR